MSERPPLQAWVGTRPFWLLCVPADSDERVTIDVDKPGWVAEHKSLMRSPGTWLLMDKRMNRPIFSVLLHEGDQFYYTKRHIGNLMAAKEVLCYGIGKKSADGTPVNLWLMPNGVICGGNDVDVLGARLMR